MREVAAKAQEIDPDILKREQNELLEYWSALFRPGRRALKKTSAPLGRLQRRTGSSSMDVRKIHDQLGWRAKSPVRCAGAIYRTRAFMEVPVEKRDASKPRGVKKANWPRNIHIEHTVPASQLHRNWMAAGDASGDARLYLARNGIATAMHASEEAALGNDYHAVNPCFDEGHGRPFARYDGKLDGSVIYNVLSGETVDLNTFSLADHERNLRDLLVRCGGPGEWIAGLGQRGGR